MASITKTTQNTWRVQIEKCGLRKSKTFDDEQSARQWAANTEGRISRQVVLNRAEAQKMLATLVPKRVLSALRDIPYTLGEVLESLVPATSFTGIYFLVKDMEVVYVGQSVDILHRISRHRREGKDFDSYSYLLCPEAELNDMEAKYITALMPWLNFTLGRVPRSL